MSPPKASIVVCTRNRSRVLTDACDAILAAANGDDWELVIVDNHSTDDTRSIAEAVAERDPGRIRVIDEPTLGLSSARNAGARAAQGEIVVFVDDDAFPRPGWLEATCAAFDAPDVMAVGGPVTPRWAGVPPEWLDGRYLPYLTVWDLGDQPLDLTYNEYPRGANVAYRRAVFDQVGDFSTHLGRKGASLLSCEETELCLRIERIGGRIRYVPDARIEHLVHAERITERWMRSRFGAQGRSEAVIDWMHGGVGGLIAGHGRFRAAEKASAEAGDRRHHHCQAAALGAYRAQAARLPFTVRRWRGPAGRALPAWRPRL